MRIAILAWESLHSVAVGGVAAHTSELADALASKGHQVHFFTRRMPGQSAHDCIDGIHYHRCFYPRHNDFVEDINNMCRAFVDKFFEIEDFVGKFDIVHAHDWLGANALIWIKQGRGHKTVLTIHSTEYARCGNAIYNGQSARIREQERAGIFWADRVIAVSEATKKEIMWMYEVPDSKVFAIDNGVNRRRFDIDVDPGNIKAQHNIGPLDPTVLFCGRLAWQKGPDVLVEAIPGILRVNPSAKFIFVGEGDMLGGLQARANNLRISHAIRFLGYRNGNELVRLFKSCDVVCVPSRNEPFGIVVLEAWSASKPVVVTENGGPNEFIRHEINGLKIYPRPDSVIWGINRIFSNFDYAREMGRNGRQFLEERFDWAQIANRTLEIYHQISPEPVPQTATESPDLSVTQVPEPVLVNSQASVKPEAEIILPTAEENEAESAVLETLNANPAGRSVKLKQKERYQKIKGDLEEVTKTLHKYRERLHEGAEGLCVPTGT